MVAGNRADGAANIDYFRGGEVGRERSDHATARHGKLNVAETQKWVATEINLVGSHRRDCAGGVNGDIALNKNHAGHVTGDEMPIIGPRRRRSPLRGDEAVALQLIGELLEGSRLKPRENQRRF